MSETNPPDGHLLTEEQWLTLRALADAVIPPSDEFAVPGAGDECICKAIIRDAKKQLGRLTDALAAANAIAQAGHGKLFADLDAPARGAAAEAFRAGHTAAAVHFATLVAQCYYRDDRIMESLGMEARPPHPQGYEVPQGDWSLLDSVRQRTRLYREAG
jgi:hypothetical protein